jgi:Fe2+ transport system protein FeoA
MSKPIALHTVRKGASFKILRIDDAAARTQLLRFGVGEGSTAVCHERLPFGPIVVKHHRQEVAIGRALAEQIWVESL